MTSLVDIWNRALSAAGGEDGVADPNENSREAALCRQWYPFVRDMVQGAAPWPSVTSYARLARIAERQPEAPWQPADPTPAFRFSFAVPELLLRPYHLQSYARFQFLRRTISTDEEFPILYFLARVTDPAQWDHDLEIAITHTLAAYVSKPLSGRSQTLEENLQIAQLRTEEARAMAANTQSHPQETLPDWLQTRGYGNLPVDKFFYPMGQINLEGSK